MPDRSNSDTYLFLMFYCTSQLFREVIAYVTFWSKPFVTSNFSILKSFIVSEKFILCYVDYSRIYTWTKLVFNDGHIYTFDSILLEHNFVLWKFFERNICICILFIRILILFIYWLILWFMLYIKHRIKMKKQITRWNIICCTINIIWKIRDSYLWSWKKKLFIFLIFCICTRYFCY